MAQKKMKLKKIETQLGKNIHIVLPMVEEITERGLTPFCVIGALAKAKEDGTGKKFIDLCFATLNDEMDASVYQFCKAFVEQGKEKYEPKAETK